jgi:hypothetical protein
MEATATNVHAGRIDCLAAEGPFAAGQLPGYWVILHLEDSGQLLFTSGQSLLAGSCSLAGRQGFYCAFTPLFMPEKLARRIERLSIFTAKHKGRVQLSGVQAAAVSLIFEQLLAELTSEYAYRLDLMRNYVVQIIHFGLKNASGGA